MKRTILDTDMMTTKSKNHLSVFKSGVFDDNGGELVISCGYSNGGKFGYFICREYTSEDSKTGHVVYEYADQSAFYPKETEYTYQQVLEDVKRMIA